MAKVGRPSKLTDEVRDKAHEYINGGWQDTIDAFPNAAGLACELGVGKRTLYDWAEKDAEFSHTLEQLNRSQERSVLAGGAKGEITHVVTKLVLANHDYGEKAQVAHTGAGGAPLTFKWEQ
jgi:hypothetical protein